MNRSVAYSEFMGVVAVSSKIEMRDSKIEQLYQGFVCENNSEAVECLGMSFKNDAARREYFLGILGEKLKDKEFRNINGFPIGSDEDILALSDPPYCTACPNPFLDDVIKHYGKPYDHASDNYQCKPFTEDVYGGKSHDIYKIHIYHTKVPHSAIMKHILHYTEPGDVVFDGFCGSGMTGIAAQLCGDKHTVEELGYKVDCHGNISKQIIDDDGNAIWEPFSRLGARFAILNDLSPAATAISSICNISTPIEEFAEDAKQLLDVLERTCGWMHKTLHSADSSLCERLASELQACRTIDEINDMLIRNKKVIASAGAVLAPINYTIWTDVFLCQSCGEEVGIASMKDIEVFQTTGNINCGNCGNTFKKVGASYALVNRFDAVLGEEVTQTKTIPVTIKYKVGSGCYEKSLDAFDEAIIRKVDELDIPFNVRTREMMDGKEVQRCNSIGIKFTHQYYTKRNLWTLACLYNNAIASRKKHLLSVAQYAAIGLSRMGGYSYFHNEMKQYLKGTLYIPSISGEGSLHRVVHNKIDRLLKREFGLIPTSKTVAIGCGDSSVIGVPDNSVDYIFTDPPFGNNLIYSDLNIFWESWLGVFTDNSTEAIESSEHGKGLLEYQHLMTECFKEFHRILKPGRWMTVVFSSSSNNVWNCLHESIRDAGFEVVGVNILDKGHPTFKQSASDVAPKCDVAISCYKQKDFDIKREQPLSDTDVDVWGIINDTLESLPLSGNSELVKERMPHRLFSRMVSYHLRNGMRLKIPIKRFLSGLKERFKEHNGMFFTDRQISIVKDDAVLPNGPRQLELFGIRDSES